MSKYTEMRDQANDSVATAIARHLKEAAALMASQGTSADGDSINEAEIIARLDLILAKLDAPAIPIDDQLWTLADVAHYLRKHVETVRETMSCLPNFPAAIRLPARGGARGHALYNAGEVIKWAASFKEARRK